MPKIEENTRTDDVVFQLGGDAVKPSQAPWGFIARNPVQRIIPPGMRLNLDMQISANVPLLVFPTRQHATDVEVPVQIVMPGQTVMIIVKNETQAAVALDDREGMVCLHPLLFGGSWSVG